MKFPKVSIIIPAYNEEKIVENLLKSLMKLDYPKKKVEVIVVDDGSTDRTTETVSKYPVKLIKGQHKGVGFARNLGWKNASSDIIIFIDADMVVDKNLIKETVRHFKKSDVAGTNNKEILMNKKSLMARLLYLRKFLGLNYSDFKILRTCRKSILKQVDGFDPTYGYYDDWELTIRVLKLGYKIVFTPKALVKHREPENMRELYRQCKWMGKSMIFSFKGYKMKAIKNIIFVVLCAFLPLYIIFMFLQFPFQILGTIGFSLFLFIEVRRSLKMFFLTKQKESFLTPIFDFISMSFVSIGIINGLLNFKQKPKV